MRAYEIDDNGFIVVNYDVNGDVEIPEGCITEQLPQPLPYYRPKWNGEVWVEGATQEEIDEITKVEPSPPTELELLQQENQLLKAQVNANASIIDFHDEVLAEIILTIVP